jgi:hypothetical protein
VQNYISWVNSHLKKRPGVKLVDNLVVDMSDGVLLIHLIEVLCKQYFNFSSEISKNKKNFFFVLCKAGDVIPDANLNPKTPQEFKENIEKVLKFMQTKSIKMHQTSSKGMLFFSC